MNYFIVLLVMSLLLCEFPSIKCFTRFSIRKYQKSIPLIRFMTRLSNAHTLTSKIVTTVPYIAEHYGIHYIHLKEKQLSKEGIAEIARKNDYLLFILHEEEVVHSLPVLQLIPLNQTSKDHRIPFSIDFNSMKWKNRFKQAKKELVVKAFGKASPVSLSSLSPLSPVAPTSRDLIVDLTAGLGRDSLIIALGSGRRVIMIEPNTILFLLLQNALDRYKLLNPSLFKDHNLVLLHGKAQDLVPKIRNLISASSNAVTAGGEVGDGAAAGGVAATGASGISISSSVAVNTFNNHSQSLSSKVSVYLDPMYPDPHDDRKSAVKKETQLINEILSLTDDHYNLITEQQHLENEKQLFSIAKQLSNDRIVVKRDISASSLTLVETREVEGSEREREEKGKSVENIYPHSLIKGNTQRFDIYYRNQLK
jgi:hypothetical protein